MASPRVVRLVGWIGLAGRRVLARATGTERTQTALTVGGIAVAVGLMLLVTSVGLGLVTASTVEGGSTDYWIVPEGPASSAVTGVERQQLGRVHRASARIERRADVTSATPVLVEPLRVNTSGEPTYLLAVGIVPSPARGSVVGLSTVALTPGDPYYAGGTYDGTWTGEAVLSAGAAAALDRSPGGTFVVDAGDRTRTFTVAAVSESGASGIGQLPVAVVHLGELQAVTGATAADSADQILVDAAPSARPALERVYPSSLVLSRQELLVREARASRLPLAMAVAALVVAVAVGTLFVVTTVGFEVAAGGGQRAVLAALGVSAGSRAVLVGAQTLLVALLGGLGGIALWLVGLVAANALAARAFGAASVAAFHPALAGYGLAVALGVGALSLPYLLVLSRRTLDSGGLDP